MCTSSIERAATHCRISIHLQGDLSLTTLIAIQTTLGVTCTGVRVETTVQVRVTRAHRTASGLWDTHVTRCTRTWITARR